SSFATRDWLDPIAAASSFWVNPFASRPSRTARARVTRNSTIWRSTSLNPRRAPASPLLKPAASNPFPFSGSMGPSLLLACLVIPGESRLATVNHGLRRLLRGLGEDIDDEDRIRVDAVDNSPGLCFVLDSQLVATRTDGSALDANAACRRSRDSGA